MSSARVGTTCPNCDRSLRIDPQLMGQTVRCPACRKKFVLSSITFASSDNAKRPKSDSPRDGESQAPPVADASLEAHMTRMNSAGSAETFGGKKSAERAPASPTGTLGRFQMHEVLGRGGFGVVYRAHDPLLDREVALKVPLFAATDRAKAQRFLNEAKAAARLRHPSIVAVYESGETDGRLYLAAEFIKGETLAQRIKTSKPSVKQSVAWVRALAEALSYAHANGIVHRDIKPHNVMIGAADRPQIMDFGLAKRLDLDSKMTSEGALLGTPAYMSPEQARGEIESVGPQSDQYSLGAVLYELITGQRPFEGPPAIVVAKAASEEPPAPRSIDPSLPQDLEAICLKAMDKDPKSRYGDLNAFAADLLRWELGESTRARPMSAAQRTRRWLRRSPVLAGLTLAIGALLIVGAIGSGVGVVLTTRSTQRLESALARAREQSEKTAEQASAAELATEEAIQQTRLANDEELRAENARQANEQALADLEAAIGRRTSVEKELANVGAEQEKIVSAKSAAELLAVSADQASTAAAWTNYAATLDQARKEIEEGRFEAARELLVACDEKLRGWEWNYLEAAARRKDAKFTPRIISFSGSVDAAAAKKRLNRDVVAVSADGQYLANSCIIGFLTGIDDIELLKINASGETELICIMDVDGYRIDNFVGISRDNRSLCAYSPVKGDVLQFAIEESGKRVARPKAKRWAVHTAPKSNARMAYVADWSRPEQTAAAFERYNGQLTDEGARVFLSPALPALADASGRFVTVDSKGAIEVSCKFHRKPLLVIPTELSFQWLNVRTFWAPAAGQLIVAGQPVVEKRFSPATPVVKRPAELNQALVFETQ